MSKKRGHIEQQLARIVVGNWMTEKEQSIDTFQILSLPQQSHSDYKFRLLDTNALRPTGDEAFISANATCALAINNDGVFAAVTFSDNTPQCSVEILRFENEVRFTQQSLEHGLDGFLVRLQGIQSLAEEHSNSEERESTSLFEGALAGIISDKYERSKIARSMCIAFHGAKCAVCGFNFEERYGVSFAGLIHVHHITPISEVGYEHRVDPINDLIPVCPNCHMALHSKADGVYSVKELKQLLSEHIPS